MPRPPGQQQQKWRHQTTAEEEMGEVGQEVVLGEGVVEEEMGVGSEVVLDEGVVDVVMVAGGAEEEVVGLVQLRCRKPRQLWCLFR
jgi:hypothetical protein